MAESIGKEPLRRKVFEALNDSFEIAEQKLDFLTEWLRQQKHLPEVPSRHMIELFLILNKFNIEKSQRKLEMYYKIRPEIPELFKNKHPASPKMQKMSDVVYLLPLPRLTPDLYLVNIVKLKDVDSRNFDAYEFAAQIVNLAELKLLSDIYTVGECFIYDLEGVSISHFFKFGIGVVKKISRISEEVYSSRVKSFHYINCPVFINALVSMVKKVLKPKLAKRIHVHQSIDTLFDYFPKDILPRDYGGDEKSLNELNEKQKEQFMIHKDRFDWLEETDFRSVDKKDIDKCTK